MKKRLLPLVSVVISTMLMVSLGGCSTFKTEPAQPQLQEMEQPQAEVPIILGAPFDYRLTELGKELLLKTNLWYEMRGIIRMHGLVTPIMTIGDTPEFLLNDYILILGAQRLVGIAQENKISSDVLIGVVATGFQEIFVQLYGID